MKTVIACLVCASLFCAGITTGMLYTMDSANAYVQEESMYLGAETGAKAESEKYFAKCTETLTDCVQLEDTMERRFAACVGMVQKTSKALPYVH